jgi:geranylgeranyl pyrophosphate synthase
MCAFKTATLARMAAKMAAVLAYADDVLVEKLGRFAESIGIAFQIQDDILDLTSSDFAGRKGGFGQDITEGKKTLIILRTLKVAKVNDKKKLLSILNMHTSEPKFKEEVISLFQKYHSIEYAKQFARKILDESWKEVDVSLPSSDSKRKLKHFTNFLIERNI